MFKRLLALFLVAMLVVPAAAIASGKSDTATSKPAGKSLERQDSQAATADDESEDGDVGTKNKREKGSKAGRAGNEESNDVDAAENDHDDDATSTPRHGKLRKTEKRLEDIDIDEDREDTATRALRKAEKEADKAEKRALKEERKLGSIDSSGTIDNSGTADNTGTARGLQRAAAAIMANIERMVDGTKNAQASLTRVLNKFNTWIKLILAGGKKNPGNGLGSNEDTETSGTAGS